jgi:hypothetical protein
VARAVLKTAVHKKALAVAQFGFAGKIVVEDKSPDVEAKSANPHSRVEALRMLAEAERSELSANTGGIGCRNSNLSWRSYVVAERKKSGW